MIIIILFRIVSYTYFEKTIHNILKVGYTRITTHDFRDVEYIGRSLYACEICGVSRNSRTPTADRIP